MEEIIALYDTPGTVDSARNVRAPGGYEWWHFDAQSAAADGDRRFVARFSRGWPLEGNYFQRYAAYRRHPTRRAPPLPAEYPAARFRFFENGKSIAGFVDRGTNSLNRFERDEKGNLQLTLRSDPAISANLIFHPRWAHAAVERAICPRAWTGAEHQWIASAPLCDVEGEIRTGNRTIPFRGSGYHDHHYGAGSLLSLNRWTWGRILDDDRTVIFQAAESRNGSKEVLVIEADKNGVREGEAETLALQGRRWVVGGISYPTVIRVGQLKFVQPVVLGKSRRLLELLYKNPGGSPLYCQIISGRPLFGTD